MRHVYTVFVALLMSACASFPAQSEQPIDEGKRQNPYAAPVSLKSLVQDVAKSEQKRFVVGAGVPETVIAGTAGIESVDYSTLLTILRSNGLAAAPVGDVINIVPVGRIRSLPLPTVQVDDAPISEEAWVNRIVTLKHAEAPKTIPILRPLLMRAGQFAAASPKTVVIVDRYGNVKRITELLRLLDEEAGKLSGR